jgi:hypothetical protein
MKQHQARFAAKSVGIVAERVKGGFYLFDENDGEQHGLFDSLHDPWTADDVLDFCAKYKKLFASRGIHDDKLNIL